MVEALGHDPEFQERNRRQEGCASKAVYIYNPGRYSSLVREWFLCPFSREKLLQLTVKELIQSFTNWNFELWYPRRYTTQGLVVLFIF